jgi:hypothetical protein
MGMFATMGDWTVEMLDALPNDGQRYEVIDGELFVTPGPVEFHQDIAGGIRKGCRSRSPSTSPNVSRPPFLRQ